MGANKPSRVQVGLLFETNNSGTLEVIKTFGRFAEIKFLKTGYVKRVSKSDILQGKVKDPYLPLIFNNGFLGEGKFKPKEHPKNYSRWFSMLRRCYDFEGGFPNYKNCTVDKTWLNFQNYMEWAVNQKGNNEKGWNLDKDLLSVDNKEYGPKTCCFLPHKINLALVTYRIEKNPLGAGVIFNTKLNKYVARTNQSGKKSKHIGCYETVTEAFDAYKRFKIKYIKNLALEYKDTLELNVFNALMAWEVEDE